MTKQFIIFAAVALAVILGGCRSDCDEPAGGGAEPLVLSISSAEAIMPADRSSRAVESEYARLTVFEAGDVVGLTVLDADSTLLADNVPYKFDGSKWDVDTEKVPESQRVYFEKSMDTYIVYYPYKKEGDGCKSIEDIKANCFPHQADQTEKDAYVLSDPMAWSISGKKGKGVRKLEVVLRHLRNSILIDPKVRWKLSNDETITYQPLREALEIFAIRDSIGDSLKVYHAPDSTYRYILKDGYDGPITWRYTYRHYKFTGSCKVDGDTIGVRYVRDEVTDMGEYDLTKALELDCFCVDADSNGYILPWDAVALLRKDRRRCIGVVHHIGQNQRDSVNYSDTPVGSEKCRGYVLALTDSHRDGGLQWDREVSLKYRIYVGRHHRPKGDHFNRDWNGYEDCQDIKEFAKSRSLKLTDFPAENSCLYYGSPDDTQYVWQIGLGAPRNTTEWFLPSDGILHHYLNYDIEKLGTRERDALVCKRFEYIKMHTDPSAPYQPYISPLTSVRPYLSATEITFKGANMGRCVFGLDLNNLNEDAEVLYKYRNDSSVRPVLVF